MKTDRKGGEREGERHAVKVVMNGIRTRDTLSGWSLCGMRLDHLASGRPNPEDFTVFLEMLSVCGMMQTFIGLPGYRYRSVVPIVAGRRRKGQVSRSCV